MSRTRGGRPAAVGDDDMEDSQLQEQIRSLKEDIDRRQAAYIRREREYRSRIELLERELERTEGGGAESKTASAADEDNIDRHRYKLRHLHENVLHNIEQVQENTQRILQEQERDLLRAFRAKLFDVQTELERANARAASGAEEWVERTKKLEKEVEWARETADRLNRHNEALMKENEELRGQYKTQEDDREYLIRQLVAAKKDNARLRQDLSHAQEEIMDLRQHAEANAAAAFASMEEGSPASRQTDPSSLSRQRPHQHHPRRRGKDDMSRSHESTREEAAGAVDVQRYKEVIQRLKRLLDGEQRRLRQLRQSLAQEVQSRTDMERLFRQCVADVQADIRKRREAAVAAHRQRTEGVGEGSSLASHSMGGTGQEPLDSVVPLDSIAPEDRRTIMERLMQQEAVIDALRGIVFPEKYGRKQSQAQSPREAMSSGRRGSRNVELPRLRGRG